jgi:diadenosine tetraphosphatase ApaH/serine/threonine PP2A family protein phosphatase
MRIALLADIHSNLVALEAVLKDIEAKGPVDGWWCLGDIVGYGPDPGPCIQRLRELEARSVAGNHDWGAVGQVDLSLFNPTAAIACRWNGAQLTEAERELLRALPLSIEEPPFTLVHGSPRDPIWEYLLSVEQAQANFAVLRTPHALIGHSHIPLVFLLRADGKIAYGRPPDGATIPLDQGRVIFNPGSVGQPRDGDPRAAYAIYDSEQGTLTHYRVEYDIPATQERIIACGLPRSLAERLSSGW